MQDATKNINVDIMWNDEKANSKIRSSKFRGRQILDHETLAIATTPDSVNRKMAFAVGFSILEFSKLEMYKVKNETWEHFSYFFINCKFTNTHSFYPSKKAWYDKIYPQFPGAQLCTSDTDSFLFTVKSKNLFEDMAKIPDFWDFSTLPKDHDYYDGSTINQLGKFKLETAADKIFSCAGK